MQISKIKGRIYVYDPASGKMVERKRGNEIPELVSFTCPRCGRISFNPTDAREGYCGACHDWITSQALINRSRTE